MTWNVHTEETNTLTDREMRDARNKQQAVVRAGGDNFSLRILDLQHFMRELGYAKYVCVHENNTDTAYWFDPRHNNLNVIRYRAERWRKA